MIVGENGGASGRIERCSSFSRPPPKDVSGRVALENWRAIPGRHECAGGRGEGGACRAPL